MIYSRQIRQYCRQANNLDTMHSKTEGYSCRQTKRQNCSHADTLKDRQNLFDLIVAYREGRVIKHKNALFKVNNSKLAQANTSESNHGYRAT